VIRFLGYLVAAGAALALEVTWLGELRPGGAVLDPLLVLVVTVGLLHGPVQGAVVGAAAGLMQDVVTGVPLGLGMLGNLCAGFCAGLGARSVYLENLWVPALAAGTLTLVRDAVWIGAGHLVGLLSLPFVETARIVVLAACYNGIIAIPLFYWLRRLDGVLLRLSDRSR